MYVFLSCTAQKKPYRCEAQKLYSESEFFSKSLEYARTLVDDNHIFILSAKHHLLKLTDVIGPYNKTLNSMSVDQVKEWAEKTLEEMKAHHIDFDKKAVFLTGITYRKFIQDNFRQFECPIEGKQIGDILHWYCRQLGTTNESLKYHLMESLGCWEDEVL